MHNYLIKNRKNIEINDIDAQTMFLQDTVIDVVESYNIMLYITKSM